jgi:hypothetical protein
MAETNQPISVVATWVLTWQLLARIKSSVLPLIACLVFLPAILIKFLLATYSNPTCSAIKAFTSKATNFASSAPNYYELFGIFSRFVVDYCIAMVVVGIPCAIAYFALTKIAIEQQLARRHLGVGKSVREGLALLLRKGLVFVLFALIAVMEQIFLGPFHIFTLFAMVAPILIINENQGVFVSLKNALLFKYCAPQTGGPFLTAFVLIALGMMVYVGESTLNILFNFILSADEFINIPRFWWLTKLPGLPFSLVYALADSIYTLGYIFLGVFTVLFINTLFFQVRLKISDRY